MADTISAAPPPPSPPSLPTTSRPRGVTAAPPAASTPPGIMRPARNPTGIPGVAAPGAGLGTTRLSREVRRLLASLGPTRGAIAAALEAAGVRATPRDVRHTPVSLFLRAVIGADPNVKSVTVDERSVVVELRAWWRPTVVVDLPAVVHEFTAAFDECCYPALLLPGHVGE